MARERVTSKNWQKQWAENYDPKMTPEDYQLTDADFEWFHRNGRKPEDLRTEPARKAYAGWLAAHAKNGG